MQDEIRIVIPGKPAARKAHKTAFLKTKAGKEFRKPVLDDDSASYQNLCGMAAQKAMGDKPPLSGFVLAEYVFIFPPPVSRMKKAQKDRLANGELLPCDNNVDLDNLMKNTNDGIKGIAITDDKVIIDCRASKRYGMKPCTIVLLSPWENKLLLTTGLNQ